jgi:DNA-binding MarR family transcriptional regulator
MNVLVAAAKMKLARPAEICEALQLDGSTLSRNLERMKARGWLEVVPDPDGRAQPFRVTKLGRKVLEELLPAWELAQKKAGAVLGQDLTEAPRSGRESLEQALARLGPRPRQRLQPTPLTPKTDTRTPSPQQRASRPGPPSKK